MTETRTAPSAGGLAPPRPPLPGRVTAARTIIWAQAPVMLLLGLLYISTAPWITLLCALGTGVLIWGGSRIGHDLPAPPRVVERDSRVPWDWTDFLMFWPAAYTASALLVNLLVPAVDQLTGGVDPTVRTAVESFVAQAAFYAGALFNIWVLAGLRRGASLQVIGWRRFSWWWLPVAVVAAWATLYIADFLQTLSQHLFPSAENTQCVAVQHEYGHFVALAVIVVCLIAPLSEETIFRGFIYGWLHRPLPVALAVPISGAIFAALHGVLLLFIPLFAVGCILAVMFQASRSLWPGAVVHALFNLPGIISILSSPAC